MTTFEIVITCTAIWMLGLMMGYVGAGTVWFIRDASESIKRFDERKNTEEGGDE